jgi:hypothetical protein
MYYLEIVKIEICSILTFLYIIEIGTKLGGFSKCQVSFQMRIVKFQVENQIEN